jgi:hypothetical protein
MSTLNSNVLLKFLYRPFFFLGGGGQNFFKIQFERDFYIRTVQLLDIIKVFYSPTNAQVIVLKTILKFTLK